MREIRLSGSVRGAGRKVRPYRDPLIPMRSSVGLRDAGRDEDFRAGTDSKAAPEDGLLFIAPVAQGTSHTVDMGTNSKTPLQTKFQNKMPAPTTLAEQRRALNTACKCKASKARALSLPP